jgi:hypothetical protein
MIAMQEPTVTVTPANGSTIYQSQVLTLIATIENSVVAFRPTDVVTFIPKNMRLFHPTTGTVNVPLQPGKTDPTKGTAKVDVVVDNSAPASVTISARTSVAGVAELPDATYTAATAPTTDVAGPDKTYISQKTSLLIRRTGHGQG